MLSLVKSKTLDYYSSRLKLNIVSYVEIFKTTLVPIKIGEVISLASLGRIVEKCSVNASGISDMEWVMDQFFHRRGVLRGKFIDCLPG